MSMYHRKGIDSGTSADHPDVPFGHAGPLVGDTWVMLLAEHTV